MPETRTKQKISIEAMTLLQEKGWGGFSFQHIADRIGIRKASLFDHYGSKEDLGLKLISDYRDQFEKWAKAADSFPPGKKIRAFFNLFVDFANNGKICPMTAFGAELNSLPSSMVRMLNDFLQLEKAWLEAAVLDGQNTGVFLKNLKPRQLVGVIEALVLGCQIAARIEGSVRPVIEAKKSALSFLEK